VPRIPAPPSHLTGPVAAYLQTLWRAVHDIPTLSYFSGTDPNSHVTGVAPNIVFNTNPTSGDSRLWLKTGSTTQPSTTGWVQL